MSRRRRVLCIALTFVGILLAYLLLWPVPIAPKAWSPPDSPGLTGEYQQNSLLANAEIISLDGKGPEDVAIDAQGRLYGGLVDGRIMRVGTSGTVELFADTEGRPLGLHFDKNGNLIVADAVRGLLSITPEGAISLLTAGHQSGPFGFTDDVDIAPDGLIYFSDASSKWDYKHVREGFFEHGGYGRLLVYDPATQQTRLLLDSLYFANGVAVSEDGSFVLVNETSEYRVTRFWLKGDRAGESEVFIENLPGLPDGISRGPNNIFWLALYSPRIADLDAILPKPWLRKVVYRLPSFLQPDAIRHGIVLGLDGDGKVRFNLQDDRDNSYSPVTSVEAVGDWLYLGSLLYPGAARVARPAAE